MDKAKRYFIGALCAVVISTHTTAGQSPKPTNATAGSEVKRAPLPLKLPAPSLSANGPCEPPTGPHVEVPRNRPRPVFYAPIGVTNVALGKPVICKGWQVRSRSLAQITDGNKEDKEDQLVRLPTGLQWVQIDLGREHQIYAIAFWHDHIGMKYFHDVLVQVSNDYFENDVRTLFNNDWDNSSGLGIGSDKEYCETHEGKLVDAKGIKARFVRLYSNGYWDAQARGNLASNEYQEIEVYAIELAPLPLRLPLPQLK